MSSDDAAYATARLDAFALAPRPSSKVVGWCNPVVRVRFFYGVGASRTSRPGSGFFLAGWNNTIVTAAHVVRRTRSERPLAVRVDLWSGAGRQVAYGVSVAYPTPWRRATDVAVIRLPRPVRVRPKLAGIAPAPAASRAHVYGYRPGRPRVRRLAVETRAQGPWLRYVAGTGMPGMSGGPVAIQEGVIGVHMGRFRMHGLKRHGAWALNASLLADCMRAAKEVAGA